MKLSIEIVPQTTWGANLRSALRPKDWGFLRKRQYKLANGVCEVCGDTGKKQGRRHDLECHEKWQYDDVAHTQTLIGLIALCPNCHEVCHFGLAEIRGRGAQALRHFMKINNCDSNEAADMIRAAGDQWRERSRHQWEVDVSWLEKDNILLKKMA